MTNKCVYTVRQLHVYLRKVDAITSYDETTPASVKGPLPILHLYEVLQQFEQGEGSSTSISPTVEGNSSEDEQKNLK